MTIKLDKYGRNNGDWRTTDRHEDVPDINVLDALAEDITAPVIEDFDALAMGDIGGEIFDEIEVSDNPDGGVFVHKKSSKQGRGPRTPKARYKIRGSKEWLPSAILGAPTPTKARLLDKLLRRYEQTSESLEWILLRQRMDDVFERLSLGEREVFLLKVKKIARGVKRFDVELQGMTVPSFAHWLIRDQLVLFDGHALEIIDNTDFGLNAEIIGVVGQTGNRLHVNFFSLWAKQMDTRAIHVDWEELQGNGRWAENVDQWMTHRFGADASPIASTPATVSLTEREIWERQTVNDWLVAYRQGQTKIEFCRQKGISVPTLNKLLKKYGKFV